MMLRSINIQYTNTRSMTLPSFEPSVGDIFGQSTGYNSMAPGLGFAFAAVGTDYINNAVDNNWLMTQDSSLISPAIHQRYAGRYRPRTSERIQNHTEYRPQP